MKDTLLYALGKLSSNMLIVAVVFAVIAAVVGTWGNSYFSAKYGLKGAAAEESFESVIKSEDDTSADDDLEESAGDDSMMGEPVPVSDGEDTKADAESEALSEDEELAKLVAAVIAAMNTESEPAAPTTPSQPSTAPANEGSTSQGTSPSGGNSGDGILQGSGTLDLSNPLALPDFIEDANTWKYDMTPAQREDAVSAALSTDEFAVWVKEIGDEPGVGYTFNAKGIALADLPLIQELTYHSHFSDDRLGFFFGDGSTLSEHNVATGDTTVRIFYYLASLVDWRGEYCRLYWYAVQHDTRNDRTTIPYGYFADVCLPVPEVYVSYPDLVPTFEMLMEVTQAGLNPLGERDGVWFFYSSLGSQSVTCPEGWTCYGTTGTVGSNPEYVLFTGTMESLNAVWVLDTVDDDLNDINLSTSKIASFITDYHVNVK